MENMAITQTNKMANYPFEQSVNRYNETALTLLLASVINME
jgi:hypothetical protein